ncbi:MAG: VOC family protein [Cytophagaceae bacterium]
MQNSFYPCLWFDGNAKEVAEFYCSIFPESKITVATPMVVEWEMQGKKFMGLNGGPHFKHSEAVSLVINCDTQAEIDQYWGLLTADGGEESMCGWCKDKFGISWQIVPAKLGMWMSHPQKSKDIMNAFLKMKKFDIPTLEKIYNE